MTANALGNWRYFFWHKWRYYWTLKKDVCVRAGCGVIRDPRRGTPWA